MNVLMLGGHGYIGSYLTKHLSNLVLPFGNKENDYYRLESSFYKNFEYIILLAGHSSVPMCDGPLKSAWLNNVSNFKDLLQKTTPDQKIIYASSSSVYGNKNNGLGTEDTLSLDYINNYDLTKSCLDLYALHKIAQGRQLVGLRLGTVNGGSPVIRRDLMINSMVFNALTNKKIYVTNKYVNRPLLCIQDLCRAIKILLVTFKPGIYNLASFNTTVEHISEEVSKQTGVEIFNLEDKPGVYNFEITSEKFTNTFQFTFQSSPQTVVKNVIECYEYEQPNIVIRNQYFSYQR